MFFKAVAVIYFLYSLIYSLSFASFEAKKGRRAAVGAMAVLISASALLLFAVITRL